jgi:hypothetical protein
MCGCKNCQGITFLTGIDGRGIVSITAQEDGTFIYLYTDGTTYTSPDLTGPAGPAGVSNFVLFNEMPIQFDIEMPGGYPFISGTTYSVAAGVLQEVAPLTLTVIEAGNYIVNAEVVFDAGSPTPKWLGYEIRVNGIVVPFTTRSIRITGGTPADVIGSYSVNAEIVGLSTGDTISFWAANIDDNPPLTTFGILILGGSMTARSY